MATVIRRETIPAPQKVHYLSNSSVVDGAANVLHAYVRNDGGTAYVKVVKIAPNGVITDLQPVYAPENSKVDGVALAQSGRDLHVVMTSHIGDQNTMLSVEVLQGACVPYPGNPQLAKEGAFVPASEPQVDVDYARITREVTASVVGTLTQAFGGDIRQGLEDKAKDAIIETLRQGGNAEVYQQLRNIAYASDMDAIRDSKSDGHAERLDAVARNEVLEGKE